MTIDDLKKSPPLVIAVLVISLATFVIIYLNPMHSVCDIQLQSLREGMAGYMFSTVVDNKKVPALFSQSRKQCREGNSAGACDDYFSIPRQLIKELNKINSECVPTVALENSYKDVLSGALQLMVTAAWGDRLPETQEDVVGWLGESELALFCDIKKIYVKFYGSEALKEIENRTFKDLPGESIQFDEKANGTGSASLITSVRIVPVIDTLKSRGLNDFRTEVKKRSLFGLDCRYY